MGHSIHPLTTHNIYYSASRTSSSSEFMYDSRFTAAFKKLRTEEANLPRFNERFTFHCWCVFMLLFYARDVFTAID